MHGLTIVIVVHNNSSESKYASSRGLHERESLDDENKLQLAVQCYVLCDGNSSSFSRLIEASQMVWGGKKLFHPKSLALKALNYRL